MIPSSTAKKHLAMMILDENFSRASDRRKQELGTKESAIG
jgi:hypothetical protein